MSRYIAVLSFAVIATVAAPTLASARGIGGGGGLHAAPQMRFEQIHKTNQLRVVPKFEQTKPANWRTDCYWTQQSHRRGRPVRICP